MRLSRWRCRTWFSSRLRSGSSCARPRIAATRAPAPAISSGTSSSDGNARGVRHEEFRMTIRPRLSPTIDWFLAGTFFGPFLVCLAGFTAAYLLGDIFDRFDTLVPHGGLGVLGLEYFALTLPLIVTQLLPIACLAGVLLGFALLNRTGEVLACQQLGISRIEMMIPVLVIGVLISGFQFVLSETVVPAATREAKYLFEVELKGRQLEGVFANRHIWTRVRGGFLSADSYDRKQMRLDGITLYRLGP